MATVVEKLNLKNHGEIVVLNAAVIRASLTRDRASAMSRVGKEKASKGAKGRR